MAVLPITHRASRSPLKEADSFLVNNDAQVHKEFNDVAKDYEAGRKGGYKSTKQQYSYTTPGSEKDKV